jgi:hypothetical protein
MTEDPQEQKWAREGAEDEERAGIWPVFILGALSWALIIGLVWAVSKAF